MAAANPGGSASGGAGAGSGGEGSDQFTGVGGGFRGLVPDGAESGTAEEGAPAKVALFPAAVRAFADVVKRSPAKESHRWTSSLGGCDLDDDVWEVRFHFQGRDNLERTLGLSDITYLNLLALIETEGYGIRDNMYYVKEKGRGMAGMELLDGMAKVEQMLNLNEDKKCIEITVVRGRTALPSDININAVEQQVPISEIGEPIVYSVDDDGVLFPSQDSAHIDDDDMQYLYTQQSNNLQSDKDKQIVVIADGQGNNV